jgi:hypothetical protein
LIGVLVKITVGTVGAKVRLHCPSTAVRTVVTVVTVVSVGTVGTSVPEIGLLYQFFCSIQHFLASPLHLQAALF